MTLEPTTVQSDTVPFQTVHTDRKLRVHLWDPVSDSHCRCIKLDPQDIFPKDGSACQSNTSSNY